MKRMILIIATIGAATASCTSAPIPDTFCTNYKPVAYSAKEDSELTRQQVKENNAVWVKLCT